MTKSILISFFDSTNIGDLTLSKCLKDQLNSHHLEIISLAYSSNIDSHTDINNIPNRSVKDIMGLNHKIKNIIIKMPIKNLWYKYLSCKSFLNEDNLQKFEKYISDCDMVVIGGGNMVFDIFPYSISANFLNYLIDIVLKYKKKILILSVGIGPFVNDYQLRKCIEVLSKVDVLTFRDEKSAELYFKNCKTENTFLNNNFISADPAFLLKNAGHKENKKKKIGINIINPYLIYKNKNTISVIKDLYFNLIDNLSDKYKIKVFATEKMDYEFIYELQNEIQFDVVDINGLNDLLDLYSSIDFLVGSRMHSIIIGLTQKIPFYGLIWQTKVESMISMFKLNEFSSEIQSTDYNDVIEKIEGVLSDNKEYLKKIEDGLNLMRNRLSINDECIEKIINII